MPDFSTVERTFGRRLRAAGLSPRAIDRGVDTGLGTLELIRSGCEVLDASPEDRPGSIIYASVEVRALVEHPEAGAFEVLDLVTLPGSSRDGALERCAEAFMDVTFPALHSLLAGRAVSGAARHKLASLSTALKRPIAWELYVGPLHVLGDDADALIDRLKQQVPLLLMFNTLTAQLRQPKIHWCKLFGESRPDGPSFGCSIDGVKSTAAEAEMLQTFRAGGPVGGVWEFRQFAVMRPAGGPEPAIAAALEAQAAEIAPPRRGLMGRLFGPPKFTIARLGEA